MGLRRFSLVSLAAALATLALATPATAAITPSSDAPTIAGALTDSLAPGELAGSSFPVIPSVPDPAVAPAATSNSGLAGLPTSGSTFAILTSGNAAFADDPNDSISTGQSNGGGGGGHGAGVFDLVTLRLDVNVPAAANCLSFDFRFLSEEFDEFVNQGFNDGFVAELDVSDFTIGGNGAVLAPHNFAFDEAGQVISVDTVGVSAANAAGTTYDGATSPLRASTPVTPGLHAVYVSIFDQGDAGYDSAALVDRLQVRSLPLGSCRPGATDDLTPPETTIDSGPAEGSTTAENDPSFAFSSSEPGSAFECKLDGGGFEPCSTPRGLTDLADGVHGFSVRAFDAAGNVDPTPAERTFRVTAPTPPGELAPPVAGRTANLEPVSGRVGTKCRGEKSFSPLAAPDQVSMGCLVDTRKGRVKLTSAQGRSGKTQTAEFYGGLFRIKQKLGKTETVLALAGPLTCKKRPRLAGPTGLAKPGRKGGRGLWGNGKGGFTTRGHNGAGAVRGTIWFVGDRCDDSTIVKVKRGVVRFRDFIEGRTVTVRAGDSYVAKRR